MPGLEEERGAKVVGKPQRFQKHMLFVSMDAAPVAGKGCGEERWERWQGAVAGSCAEAMCGSAGCHAEELGALPAPQGGRISCVWASGLTVG